MDYRFYIYKQSVLVNFNKYDFSQYVLLREIDNISQWDLKVNRDRDFFTIIRTEFDGEITVIGDDYTALKALEETHIQYAVVIHQKCNGVYSEKWKGYFSYFDYKVDEDRCNIRFQPTVWDKYSPVFDQMPVERNVIVADTDWIMRMDAYQWPWESITLGYVSFAVTTAVWHESSPGTEFYLYSIYSHLESREDDGTPIYSEEFKYRRDYALILSDSVPPTPGGNWVYLEEVSPGVHKWIRPFLNSNYTGYSNVVSGDDVFQGLLTSSATTVYLYGLKRLSKILEYYADFINLDYVSNFFNNDPCPMGGDTLEWTMLQQISNLKAIGEQATKGMMKLKDLLLWIRDTFNVYPYIDSSDDFRLEHRRYFDNGLSYAYTHIIELDLTSVTYRGYVNKMNKYEYEKPSLARYEKLELQYSNFSDWVDAEIEYPQYSILGNETKIYSADWGTDIVSMNDSRDELPDKGWILLNCNLVGAFYEVINTVGAITGIPIQNGRFSQANLFRDLWSWGRLLPTGNVNGVATTFDSIQKLKRQQELSFPQCCEEIDYNGLVRTELGDGIIDSAIYESKSGNLKVNLIYE